jgi:hypothetical protein
MIRSMTTTITPHRDRAILAVLTIICLGPFLAKAFHVDDPLFIWTAQHIAQHPLDFYGFSVNWYGVAQPMSEVTQNPPLMCYFLATVGALFGWSEPVMHAACLLPAIAAIWGVHALALRCGSPPLACAVFVLACPAFLVSATSVMCDVSQLALWIWAVVVWIDGLAERKRSLLFLGGLLVAAAALTKYFGVSLIPLLTATAIAKRAAPRLWVPALIPPVAVVVAYELATRSMYGVGLLGAAVNYRRTYGGTHDHDAAAHLLIGLAYVGGCLLPALPAALLPGPWRQRALRVALAAAALGVIGATSFAIGGKALGELGPNHAMQFGLMAFAGAIAIVAVSQRLARERHEATVMLVLWIAGTLAFAVWMNWAINARSILPMAPAVAIVLLRSWPQTMTRLAIVPCLAVSLWLAYADTALANAARGGAAVVVEHHGKGPQALWFEGHWGFQYYMQRLHEGQNEPAQAIDVKKSDPHPGDLLALPVPNTNVVPPDPRLTAREQVYCSTLPRGVTLLSPSLRARFYASASVDVPFLFHTPDPACVVVVRFLDLPAPPRTP